MTANKVLVYGGKGALGQAVAAFFKKNSYHVISVDLFANDECDANIVVSADAGLDESAHKVDSELTKMLNGERLAAIFCVAGGWAGGNAASAELMKNTDLMVKQSLWTSIICASISSKHLAEGGLLVLTGSQPCLKGTSGMLGYGAAKAAVHQLTQGLGQDGSGMPAKSTALAILPVTLDTPMNRKFMPDADHSTWTPMETVAQRFLDWLTGKEAVPASGSLVQLFTAGGATKFVCA